MLNQMRGINFQGIKGIAVKKEADGQEKRVPFDLSAPNIDPPGVLEVGTIIEEEYQDKTSARIYQNPESKVGLRVFGQPLGDEFCKVNVSGVDDYTHLYVEADTEISTLDRGRLNISKGANARINQAINKSGIYLRESGKVEIGKLVDGSIQFDESPIIAVIKEAKDLLIMPFRPFKIHSPEPIEITDSNNMSVTVSGKNLTITA